MSAKRVIVIDPQGGGPSPMELFEMHCVPCGKTDGSGPDDALVGVKCTDHVQVKVRNHREMYDAIKHFMTQHADKDDDPAKMLCLVAVANVGIEGVHIETMLRDYPGVMVMKIRRTAKCRSAEQMAAQAYTHFTSIPDVASLKIESEDNVEWQQERRVGERNKSLL